jgi:hypothetical protein
MTRSIFSHASPCHTGLSNTAGILIACRDKSTSSVIELRSLFVPRGLASLFVH